MLRKKIINLLNTYAMKLFSKENGIAFVVTLTAVMVGLAVHQVYVAPMLVKKASTTPAGK